jgi:hypothetical protein
MKLPPILSVPGIDFADFSKRWNSYLNRRQVSRKKLRERKLAQQKARLLRPFFPQSGIKVERVDTNEYNRALGRVYVTMSNGQVLRPDRLLQRRDANPVLREKLVTFFSAQT